MLGVLLHPISKLPWRPIRFPSFSGNGEEARRAWEKQENTSQVKKRLPTFSSTVTLSPLSYLTQSINGQVSEWSNEHAWKVCVLATVPRVRIPPCPPSIFYRNIFIMNILRFLFVEVWGKNGEKRVLQSNNLLSIFIFADFHK